MASKLSARRRLCKEELIGEMREADFIINKLRKEKIDLEYKLNKRENQKEYRNDPEVKEKRNSRIRELYKLNKKGGIK